jgi:hypothetical protein
MTPPIYLLLTSGLGALLALMLSITPYVILARRVALAAIWLALAVVPVAVGLDVSEGATIFTQVLEHVREYGGLALPCAFVASLALSRAKAARRR